MGSYKALKFHYVGKLCWHNSQFKHNPKQQLPKNTKCKFRKIIGEYDKNIHLFSPNNLLGNSACIIFAEK